ncbi:MAG: exodeoxyribonuclease VII small subunit [Rhodothermales bacterium]|jgi:exodeoxyribonuclease VII small subunit
MSSNDAPETESFEQSLVRLERITAHLEDPGTGLEDAIVLYENGTELARLCMQRLRNAEQRVEKLTEALASEVPSDNQTAE